MDLILHIGTEKTGTTGVQDWLYANAGALRAAGVYLPESLGMPNNWRLPTYFSRRTDNYHLDKMNIRTAEEKAAFFASLRDDLRAEVARAGECHTCLITSEQFHRFFDHRADVAALREYLLTVFERVTVLCYFREQGEMARSLYTTHVMGGGTMGVAEFVETVRPESAYWNFGEIAGLWSGVFGRENCVFRVYDRGLFEGGDVRRDVLQVLGIKAGTLDMGAAEANVSRTELELRAVLEVGRSGIHGNQLDGVNARSARVIAALRSAPSLQDRTVRSHAWDAIPERFREVNREFSQTYFQCEDVFASRAPGQAEERAANSDEVLDMVGALSKIFVAELARDVPDPAPPGRSWPGQKWRDTLDFRLHRWLSTTRLVSKTARLRFAGAAERREARLLHRYGRK